MIRILAVAACLLAAAFPQSGKHKGPMPGQGVDWQGDWDAASKEAIARNVPILFYVGQDG